MRKLSKDSIQRKSVSIRTENLMKMSVLNNNNPLPLIICPDIIGVNFREWLQENIDFVNQKILKHGGVLFRGFSMRTKEDFHNILEELNIPLMNYVEGATPRTAITNKVYTSTEFPQEYKIQLHNELSYVKVWPMKICFFCEQAPDSGGETIIADMRRVYLRIPKEIRDEFEQRKWKLIRNYDPNFSLSWQKSFGLNTKKEIELYCRNADLKFTWKKGDVLQTSCVRDAVQTHPITKDKIWFNHVAFWHPSMLSDNIKETFLSNFKEEDLPYNTTYGDGGLIPDEVIEILQKIQEEETIAEPWQKGDLMVLDNMLTAHGRNSYDGDRRIFAAMGEASNLYI
jgi:alpha-ketoglutarate-dependent taurine dioxygenase